MPVSKKGKLYFTAEQLQRARENDNALEYALRQGYPLVKEGLFYRMKDHDSMVFTPRGKWFWNSQNLWGGAIEFQMYYEGKTYVMAVLELAGEVIDQYRIWSDILPSSMEDIDYKVWSDIMSFPMENEPIDFKLPERAENNARIYEYLCKTRGLDGSVFREMVRQGRLYQSAFELQSGKTVYNAVFVCMDDQGKAIGAIQRGIYDGENKSAFKGDVAGSDKRFGWGLPAPNTQATELRVFEAPIDAASDASLDAIDYGDGWMDMPVDRLSLGGLLFEPIKNYLDSHPDIRSVSLMLDGDKPGREAAERFMKKMTELYPNIEVKNVTPPIGKDWNETLQNVRAMQQELAEEQARGALGGKGTEVRQEAAPRQEPGRLAPVQNTPGGPEL